jgi:hypothetical protein
MYTRNLFIFVSDYNYIYPYNSYDALILKWYQNFSILALETAK